MTGSRTVGSALTLTNLCQAMGTSSCALCYGFQIVTEVAAQFGFYYLGCFARNYKQLFGEFALKNLETIPVAAENSG